jgi:hypothetical protein
MCESMRAWLAVMACAPACHHTAPAAPTPAPVAKEDDEAAHRAWVSQIVAARHRAKVPDAGATVADAMDVCMHDEGQPVDRNLAAPNTLGCQVGGELVFACQAESNNVRQCTHYEEGESVADVQRREASEWGTPDSTSTVAGYPVLVWSGGALVIGGYARGVAVTHAILSCRKQHGVCVSGPASIETGAKCAPYEAPEHGAVPRLSVEALGMTGRIDVSVSTLGAPCTFGPVVSVERRDHTITVGWTEQHPGAGDGVWSFHVQVEPLQAGPYEVQLANGEGATQSVSVVVR